MDDELRKLAEEVLAETDSIDVSEWRDAARKLARAVLEMQDTVEKLRIDVNGYWAKAELLKEEVSILRRRAETAERTLAAASDTEQP